MVDGPTYDQTFWEALWAKTVREHAGVLAERPPTPHLLKEVAGLAPGRAVDAGCGHGTDALWLAAHGWRVTGLDFSDAALAYARARAESLDPEIAARVEWAQADLGAWTPDPRRYDLISCMYDHMAGSVEAAVERLAEGVAPGGTLLMVGHRPIDPSTGAETAAAGQNQVSVEAAVAALDRADWDLLAEERPRAAAGTGVDAVIRARRIR
ncbi:MAG: class I SAM-dependent methyltransferase [Sandaracinaceae bacterium]